MTALSHEESGQIHFARAPCFFFDGMVVAVASGG